MGCIPTVYDKYTLSLAAARIYCICKEVTDLVIMCNFYKHYTFNKKKRKMPFHSSTRLMYGMSLKLNGLIKWGYEILPLQFDLYLAYLLRTCEVYIIVNHNCLACRSRIRFQAFYCNTTISCTSYTLKHALFFLEYLVK